jgi:hypothetical protein
MEPQLPNPNAAPGQGSPEQKTPELAPRPNSAGSEVQPAQPLEQLKSVESHEQRHGVVSNATSLASTLPVVVPSPLGTDDTTQALGQVATISASDDDVIEKEWVNKSKKIIKDTKGDPYRKEHEVSKLQADYMLKRYGKDVKIPDDI